MTQRKNVPSRGDCKCKNYEMEMSLLCSRSRNKPVCLRGKEPEGEVDEVEWKIQPELEGFSGQDNEVAAGR